MGLLSKSWFLKMIKPISLKNRGLDISRDASERNYKHKIGVCFVK